MNPDPGQNNGIRVLLVEDEYLIAGWVADALSEQGLNVLVAGSAAEALRHLERSPVDILLTDINLRGGMDGAALARRVRELLPHLPVIYASARIAMLAPEARVPGAKLLAKPYDPQVVGRLIADAMQSAKVPVPA